MGNCQWCAAQSGAALCLECVGRFAERARRARWLVRQIEINVTRQSQAGTRFREGGRSTETPLVFDDAASEAAWVLDNTLASIARRCMDAWGFGPVDPDDLAGWLEDHAVYVARVDDAGDMLGELDSAVRLCLEAIDNRQGRRIYIGDCRCGTAVYGDEDQGELAGCRRCGEIFRVAESRQANRNAGRELLVTADEAAKYAGSLYGVQITAKIIRVWGSRGKIEGRGRDRQGVTVYRLGDIVEVARNPQGRRR